MKKYIEVKTREYPLFENDIKSRFKNISWSVNNFIPPAGFSEVIEIPQPVVEINQEVIESNPQFVNGQWQQKWNIRYLTDEQVERKKQELIAQTKVHLKAAINKRLDDFAKTRDYDNIMTACSYFNSTDATYAAEAQTCIQARDQTWQKYYEIIAEIEAGSRPLVVSYDDIETELPVLSW